MAPSATQLTLRQLTDCALMGPELGTVNFRLLNTILHVLIGQIGVGDIKVEFKGPENEVIQKFYDPSKIQGDGLKNIDVIGTKMISSGLAVSSDQDVVGRLIQDVEDLKLKCGGANVGADLTTLVQRVEASEDGLVKMASLVEDLAKETGSGGGKIAEHAENLRKSIDIGQGGLLAENLKEIDRRLTELEHKITPQKPGDAVLDETFSKTDLTNMDVQDALKLIQTEFKNVRNVIQTLNVPEIEKQLQVLQSSGAGTKPGGGGDVTDKMTEIEQQFRKCIEQVESLDKMFNNNLEVLTHQVHAIEIEMGSLHEKISGIGEKDTPNQNNLTDIYKKFEELETKNRDIENITGELMEEKEERHMHMAALKEQVELLKDVKADKLDVEGQLAEKIDIGMINRKVSHEQFDATCTDLTKSIEEALFKLTNQETLWQQALTDIQTEIGCKLDKMELGPLKDFITEKLGVLQSKMKALSKLKRDQEAAATKAALLKDVKCISCDQDVVMKKHPDSAMYPQQASLPPTKTMAPYLAYELDQLRKQQKNLGISRNLHHFEQAKKGDTCNRYCGGSHTLTTPQQRVTRLGHFLEQWGPEISMVTDSEIKGRDGMIYKGEDKGDKAVILPPETAARTVRPSMVVHGDILTSRPGFELPEKLSEIRSPKTSVTGGSRTGIVTFNEPAASDKG